MDEKLSVKKSKKGGALTKRENHAILSDFLIILYSYCYNIHACAWKSQSKRHESYMQYVEIKKIALQMSNVKVMSIL